MTKGNSFPCSFTWPTGNIQAEFQKIFLIFEFCVGMETKTIIVVCVPPLIKYLYEEHLKNFNHLFLLLNKWLSE